MKKTYIAPKTKAYSVSVQQIFALSNLNEGGDGDFVKEEKSEKGAGIWNLYE